MFKIQLDDHSRLLDEYSEFLGLINEENHS